jgi:hypothetical protein
MDASSAGSDSQGSSARDLAPALAADDADDADDAKAGSEGCHNGAKRELPP